MIEALDETIKQLLVQKGPFDPADIDISFDVPNREWSAAIAKPTINVYLYDIRENLDLRPADWELDRRGGRVVKSKLGRRFDLSYLITAWTSEVEDEHRLLWYVLATTMRFPLLPDDVLQGSLRNQPFPLQTKVAQPETLLRNAADVWTALDNQLKPLITYVVTVSLDPHDISEELVEVRTKLFRFNPPGVLRATASGKNNSTEIVTATKTEQYIQIGGFVTDQTNTTTPVRRAEVVLVEQGLNTRTDAQGRYTFNSIAERPKYTLLVVAPGYKTERREVTIPAPSYDFQLQPEEEEA